MVYDTFLRPFVMQYEPNIEQRLGNLRAKSGQVLVFYIKNFTDKGMTFFLEVVHQVVSPPPNREHIRHEVKLIVCKCFLKLDLIDSRNYHARYYHPAYWVSGNINWYSCGFLRLTFDCFSFLLVSMGIFPFNFKWKNSF